MEELVYSLAAFSILQFLILIYIGYKAVGAWEVLEKCGLTWKQIICGPGMYLEERQFYKVREKDKTSAQKLDLLLEEMDFEFQGEKHVKEEAKLIKKDDK